MAKALFCKVSTLSTLSSNTSKSNYISVQFMILSKDCELPTHLYSTFLGVYLVLSDNMHMFTPYYTQSTFASSATDWAQQLFRALGFGALGPKIQARTELCL